MTYKNSAKLRQDHGQVLSDELERLSAAHEGILAAQVCTSDGFEVASTRGNGESHRRLAAMVSSMQALGAAVVEETEIGLYQNLIVDATLGKCIMMAIPGTGGDMLLTVVASSDLALGMCLVSCKNTCKAISEHLSPGDSRSL